MNRSRPRSLPGLPRILRRGSRALARPRELERLQPRLRVDAGAPELVLSPHWDDAALDCWSLLSSDRELNVVNLFAGIPTAAKAGVWEAVIGASDPAERARRRLEEDALALRGAGREPLNLPLLDASYRRQQSIAIGLDEVDRTLSATVTAASRVYVPAGIGGHADHLLARDYGRTLLRAGMPVSVYAELPYCIFHGWPSWVDGSEPQPDRDVDAYWQSFLGGVPEMPALRAGEVQHLDATASEAKLAAIRCYRTSLNHSVRQLLSDPAFHAFEVRWALMSSVRL